MGYIYIMTNPSFEEYVKIGYAKDVKQRLDDLNRSSAVPFAFRIYATYEVDSELSDKKLHSILDKLNPELRSTEEINGYTHLKKWKATAAEKKDEEAAQEISEAHQERMKPFRSQCAISPSASKLSFALMTAKKAGRFARLWMTSTWNTTAKYGH